MNRIVMRYKGNVVSEIKNIFKLDRNDIKDFVDRYFHRYHHEVEMLSMEVYREDKKDRIFNGRDICTYVRNIHE